MGAVKRTHRRSREEQSAIKEFRRFVWDSSQFNQHPHIIKKRKHYNTLLKEFKIDMIEDPNFFNKMGET